MMQYILIKNVK